MRIYGFWGASLLVSAIYLSGCVSVQEPSSKAGHSAIAIPADSQTDQPKTPGKRPNDAASVGAQILSRAGTLHPRSYPEIDQRDAGHTEPGEADTGITSVEGPNSKTPDTKISAVGPAEDAQDVAIVEAAFSQPGTQDIDRKKFLDLCGCDKKVRAAEGALILTHREEMKANNKLLAAAEERFKVLSESFAYVEVTWIKRALLSLNLYRKSDLTQYGLAETVRGNDYNASTSRAVEEFQCRFYTGMQINRDAKDTSTCLEKQAVSANQTGWMTYLEGRYAICSAGFRAVDNTAVLVGNWYANGNVYGRNLPYANWLMDRLSSNLKTLIPKAKGSERDFLVGVSSDARVLQSFIDTLIDAEANLLTEREEAEAKLTGIEWDTAKRREVRRLHAQKLRVVPGGVVRQSDLCPRDATITDQAGR